MTLAAGVHLLEEIDRAIAAELGNGALINLWATWCAPCVAELPNLVRVAAEYESAGGRVFGISQDLFLPNVSDADALAKVGTPEQEHRDDHGHRADLY